MTIQTILNMWEEIKTLKIGELDIPSSGMGQILWTKKKISI